MKYLLLTLFFFVFSEFGVETNPTSEERVSYSGHQLCRIYTRRHENEALNQLFQNQDVKFFNERRDGLDVIVKPNSLDKLKKTGIKYEVLIEDLQKLIDEENQQFQKRHLSSFWKSYHTLDEIYSFLDTTVDNHPEIASVQSFGKTVENRPMKLLKISNNNSKNVAIWIDGAIHAREWISSAAVIYIINHIVHNFNQSIFENVDWYIAPVLNPDGYVHSHTKDRFWRKNKAQINDECVGVDLNRNFGFKWLNQYQPCEQEFEGKGPFSEPETIAIRDFFQKHKGLNWKGFISFHSFGQIVLFPWGYDRLKTDDYEDLDKVAQKIVKTIQTENNVTYTAGPIALIFYPATGSSLDWAKNDINIKYSYGVELRPNGSDSITGFEVPVELIEATSKDALIVVETIAKASVST